MRLFIASRLTGPAALAAAGLMAAAQPLFGGSVKWTRPENLHLTYLFLGETPAGELPRLGALLRSAATGFAPVKAELDGLGAFPSLAAARLLWLGLREAQPGQLAAFAGLLAAAAPAGGKGFVPHITLGRLRTAPQSAALNQICAAAALRQPVEFDSAGLFESRPGAAGPEYTELLNAPFTG